MQKFITNMDKSFWKSIRFKNCEIIQRDDYRRRMAGLLYAHDEGELFGIKVKIKKIQKAETERVR